MPQINVVIVDPSASLPVYATFGAACFDIAAVVKGEGVVTVYPGEAVVVGTGLSFQIPPGYVMRLFSRSGHGFKNNIRLSNSVGVIDSDYRGEVKASIHNDGDKPFQIRHGDRILQGAIDRVEQVAFIQVALLDATERGDGGMGSTGSAMHSIKTQTVNEGKLVSSGLGIGISDSGVHSPGHVDHSPETRVTGTGRELGEPVAHNGFRDERTGEPDRPVDYRLCDGDVDD